MRRDPILVEFLGLPGAGKSVISRRLAEVLEGRGLTVSEPSRVLAHGIGRTARKLRKALQVGFAALGHPIASMRAAGVVVSSGQPSTPGALLLWINWVLVTSLARRARSGAGVQLLDEGPLQGAWSVALEGEPASAGALLGLLPAGARPDLLVIVEAPSEVVAGRIRERPENDSRLDRRLDAEPDLLDRGLAALLGVRAAAAASLGPAGIVVLHNEQAAELERGVMELADRVAALTGRSGSLD
ncbi:MAG: hypothetical protein ACYTG2_07675 [Planctomycetota bacterium]|jgi:predicted kinase